MIERDSALGNKQKFSIQSNELTRRLMNIDTEMEEDDLEEEVVKTIEHYTKQVKNSGSEVREAREMVVSGYIGWKRRLKKRKDENECIYRSGAGSLQQRTRKK